MPNFNESEEEIKTRGKMYAITTLSVISVIIIYIISLINSINTAFDVLFTKNKRYYVLDVDNQNKDKVIELFQTETENINYCNSIYKIEYYIGFPDGKNYTMYCKDEDNITFSIDKVEEDTLATYIYKKGTIETK